MQTGLKPLALSHPLAVRYRTRDLPGAERLLCAVLGIPVRERGPGFVCLDNSSICLWLVEDGQSESQEVLTLVLAATDVAAAVRELEAHQRVRLWREPAWTGPGRLEAELRVEEWLHLVIGRTYNEDELGIVPELATELDWEEPARLLLKELLRQIPLPFRQNARERSVAASESNAMARGEVVVNKQDAMRAIVTVAPRFQHRLLRNALLERGEDLSAVAEHLAHLDGNGL